MKTAFALLLLVLLSVNCALLWRIDSKLSGVFPNADFLTAKDKEVRTGALERLPAVRLVSPVLVQAVDPLPVEVANVSALSVKVTNGDREAVPVSTPTLNPLEVKLTK